MVDLQVPSILTSGVGTKGAAHSPLSFLQANKFRPSCRWAVLRGAGEPAIREVPQAFQAQQTKNRIPPLISYCFWLS